MKKISPSFISKTIEERLYHSKKPIIGITGSIGSGKSTFCQYLINKGFSIIDADKLIKNIYKKENVLKKISNWSPSSVKDKEINFRELRSKFYSDPDLKMNIENLLYQHLPGEFEEESRIGEQDFIFYDVPLLFEKKLEHKLDQTILIYAPYELCLKRVIARDQIEKDLAVKMFEQQMPIEEKKKLANFVIDNLDERGPFMNWPEVDNLLAKLLKT